MADYQQRTAPGTVATEVATYQDLVNRLLDGPFGQLARDGRNMRLARRSVLRAYRDLPTMHKWGYYERRGQLTTVASQTTGTVSYDHTGGAAERLVTVVGATFPTDAHFYHLLIGTRTYQIQKYLTSTTVQLTEETNPGADVASGTSYTLFKSLYPAPAGLRRVSPLINLSEGSALDGVSNAELTDFLASNYTPQREVCYTIRNNGSVYGGLQFELAPPPSTARTYDYAYEVAPRALQTEQYSAGTVTVASGATTVTGTGTAFADKHVGSVIRFSATGTTPPTPPEGSIEADNPYVAQRTITAVASATSLTIDSVVSSITTYTGVKYVISDPLDVEPYSMLTTLERLAVAYFAEELNISPGQEKFNWRSLFERDLVRAKIADNQLRDSTTWITSDKRLWSLSDWLTVEAA